MIAGSRTLGAIVFRFARDRDFDDGTRDLAIRLADQGAQALDRALAWDGDRRSREALERGQGRLALLVRASDALGSGTDIGTGIAALPGLIVPSLADWCAIELLDVDAPELEIGARLELRDVVERLAGAAPRSLGSWLVPASAGNGPTILALGDGATDVPEAAATALAELGTVELLAMPISTPGGDPQGSIVLGASDVGQFGPDDQALVQDLAGRIAAAAERSSLFAAVTRFKATVDVSADAVYMFDPGSLRLTYVNRGGADLLGAGSAGLVGTSVLELQPAVSERVFRARLADLREAPSSTMTYSEVLARADGREFPAEVILQEVTLRDGTRTVVLTARDISERIDVQARLARIAGDERRQAAELRAVIQSMGEGVLVVDADGGVSMANEAASVLLGADLAAGLADVERRASACGAGSARRTAGTGRGHGRADRAARGRAVDRDLDLSRGARRRRRGRARTSRIVVLRDVSEARDAEAAREAFLGVLSHELRTPVTTIFGYAKVLQRPSLRDDQAEMLGDIEAEADRLYRIVEDLLALSRVEGGITIDGEPVLLQHLDRARRRVGVRPLGPGRVRDAPASQPARRVRGADLRRAGPAEPDLERRQVRDSGDDRDGRGRGGCRRGPGPGPRSRQRGLGRGGGSPVRAVLSIAAGHADRVRRRDRPVCQPWPDHGDGRADLDLPPRRRRVRVRVQPAPLPGGPRAGRRRLGKRERGLTARRPSQPSERIRGVRSTRPGGWGRLVRSNSRVSITIATAEGRDARIAS